MTIERATTGRVCGIVLAAGAGTRYGCPKALARDEAGAPWVARIVRVLSAASCAPVLVALGAQRERAVPLVPAGAELVPVVDWAQGLSVTLRVVLEVAAVTRADAALIVPVDVPDLPVSVCHRVRAAGADAGTRALVRAVFADGPGHPVLIGRDHWAGIAAEAVGDAGAGPYLRRHGVVEVPCADLWDGADRDRR